MIDPVVAADGHSYSREAIATWLARPRSVRGGVLSPMTGQPLPSTQLLPNFHLRAMVLEWQQQQQQQQQQ